jgi:serine/threonine-protein kinase
MGEVWKARLDGAGGFSRTLVVKRLLPHLLEDGRFVDMFLTEARLSAQLLHPNIVQIFELGEHDGEFFLAMEYVHGRDLGRVISHFALAGHPPPVPLAAYATREVCRALAYAHQLTDKHGARLGLIHRDVSPSNVMLSMTGAVKLLDFGVAKAAAESQNHATQTGVLKGKLWYMAPERVDGKSFDHRSDIFSTGVVLYEALTATRLFEAKNPARVINLICSMPIAPPSSLNPDVPPELDRICIKALARNPDERYGAADEMARELDDLLFKLRWGAAELARLLSETFSLDTHVEPAALEPAPERERVSPSDATQLAKGRTPGKPVEAARPVNSHEVTAPSSRRTTMPDGEARTAAIVKLEGAAPAAAVDVDAAAAAVDVEALTAAVSVPAASVAVTAPRSASPTQPNPTITDETPFGTAGKITPLPPLRAEDQALIRDEVLFGEATHVVPPGQGRTVLTGPPPPFVRAPERRFPWRWSLGGLLVGMVIVLVTIMAQSRGRTHGAVERVALTITSDPPGAQATISGTEELRGRTPLTAHLPRGESYVVRVAQPGYEPSSEPVLLDKDMLLKFVLKPLR